MSPLRVRSWPRPALLVLRGERRAAIEVHDRTAQAEFRQFDGVVAACKDHGLPPATSRVNLDAKRSRLNQQNMEIIRGLPIAAQLGLDLGPRIRRREYFGNQ